LGLKWGKSAEGEEKEWNWLRAARASLSPHLQLPQLST
jgi:hypothetical protein